MLFLPRAHSCLVTELLDHFVIGHQFEFYIKSQHACRGHQLHCSRICGKKSSDLEEEQPRRVAQADRARTGDDDEDVADAVAPVVEQLPHRTRGTRAPCLFESNIRSKPGVRLAFPSLSSRLLSVDGVQRLVNEQTQSAQKSRPPRSLSRCHNFNSTSTIMIP